MKKKLLTLTMLSLFAIGFSQTAKAGPSADSTLTGTLASHYDVTPTNGSGTIDYDTGTWTITTSPAFSITTNKKNYKIRISAVAGDSGATQALGAPAVAALGKVRMVIATSEATALAVANARDTATADPAQNSDAIAYDTTFVGTGVTFDAFSATPLVGTVANKGTTVITGSVQALGNGSYGQTTDTAGVYTSTITLLASDT